MSAIVDPTSWAEQTFGPCQLGDQRRTNRLIQMAQRVIENPSGSLSDQMLDWAELKAAYRLFDTDGVTLETIASPHWKQTCRQATGQTIHYRTPKISNETRMQRLKRCRESEVWGRLIDQIGPPCAAAQQVYVCDRGTDNFEVFCHLVQLKTLARANPDHKARRVIPLLWLQMLKAARKKIRRPHDLTISEFYREVAKLGGFGGRKSDGDPGWITIWRGWEKLTTLIQGAKLARQLYGQPEKCG